MALELFVNYERTSNNGLFYRPISLGAFTCWAKLSNLEGTQLDQNTLVENYYGRLTLDKGNTFTDFNLLTGEFLSIVRPSPIVVPIEVYLYNINDTSFLSPLEIFSLSACFVTFIPKARMITWPHMLLDERTGQQELLDKTNYLLSRGNFFYGEGHTETFSLSTSLNRPFARFQWLVGNKVEELSSTSLYPVLSTIDRDIQTVEISSNPGEEKEIPLSLRITTNQIISSGPVFYYDDDTGVRKLYDYVATSLIPDPSLTPQRARYQTSIYVRTYPNFNNFQFESPFLSNVTTLPPDYKNLAFTGSVKLTGSFPLFQVSLSTTSWQLATETDSFSVEGNWLYQTVPLPKIAAYQFSLGYETQFIEQPSLFKISSIADTVVSSTVAIAKKIEIKLPPYDWQPRLESEIYSDRTIILTPPALKIYAPNYYNLMNAKHEEERGTFYGTKFYLDLSKIAPKYELTSVTISATHSLFGPVDGVGTFTLNKENLLLPFYIDFAKIGTQTLTAVSTVLNEAQQEITITNIFKDIVDISYMYDSIQLGEEYYKSEKTQSLILSSEAPLISPNEWTVEDNINSSILKIYNTVDEFKTNIFRYKPVSFLYGWMGYDKYAWSDLECNVSNKPNLAWNKNECDEFESQLLSDQNDGFPLYWTQQQCDVSPRDPNCFQKYCIEWRWKSRQRQPATILTTWKSTQSLSTYSKKWKYEPCEIDSVALNCQGGRWHISTIDPEYFPIPFCSSNEACEIQSCVKMNDNTLVVAYKSELNVLSETYNPKFLSRRGIADEIFNFASIKGISVNRDGTTLYVLDSALPRICAYKLQNNNLILTNSWGRFGLRTNGYGLNNPHDICVDPNTNNVIVSDVGNKCLKIYSSVGRHLKTIYIEEFENLPPLSVAVDSKELYHVLLSTKVVVLNNNGEYQFEYQLPSNTNPTKIAASYNLETLYITHENGLLKYFRSGTYYDDMLLNIECENGNILSNFNGVHQDKLRNVFVCVNDKLLLLPDKMLLEVIETEPLNKLYWQTKDVLIGKEEYIQPWVYIKSFHRLWDNIELIRTSLPHNNTKNKEYLSPKFDKNLLTIGQNELVTNSVINRLLYQLWSNVETLSLYFK